VNYLLVAIGFGVGLFISFVLVVWRYEEYKVDKDIDSEEKKEVTR